MESKEEKRWRSRTAEQALDHAKALLKPCGLLELWKFSSRLSLHETLTRLDEPLCVFPMVNCEQVRLLSHTILASRANYAQEGRLLEGDNFRKIFNDCNHGLYDPDEMKPLQAASGSLYAHLEFERFITRLGAVQMPGQEPFVWERAGRLVAMLEDLPRRHPDRIPEGQRKEVERVFLRVEEVLGARVSELARAFRDVLSWQLFVHKLSLRALSTRVPSHTVTETDDDLAARQANTAIALLEPVPVLDESLVFTLSRMLSPFDAKVPGYAERSRPRVEAFMRLASRSADELRALLSNPEFTIGHAGKRLSPLERFPVVRIDDPAGGEPRYVVPNYRHLAKSFTAIVDFALHEAFGKDYEHARGALFHLYLRQLIEDRLPQVVVIPETSYNRSKGRKESPDLTLVEQPSGRLIALEVKGMRINLATRLSLGDEVLEKSLGDTFKALCKLPRKVAELRAEIPEFQHWRMEIAATGDSTPILVAVVREGLHLLSHLIREQARLDADHPLHMLAEPYCILSADAFERAIEIAHRTTRSLSELLEWHHERSGSNDHTGPGADSFGENTLSATGTYAASFLKPSEWDQR